MVKVTGNDGLTVFYECDCGVKGQCMIKPLSDEGIIITDIKCPICLATERVKMAQDSETDKMSWGCVIYNEVTDYELREELDDQT
jgi:hypothetical protein